MSDGWLSTHVLDTARGCPAAGIGVTLYRITGMRHQKIAEAVTNADGRTDAPLLAKGKMVPGCYELVFDAGAYLDAVGPDAGAPRFLAEIPIRFGIADAQAHYHVPLLLSPYGYATYRGS